MWNTDPNGRRLGSQEIIANTPITPVNPTEGNISLNINPFPSSDDARHDNVMFDTENGWIIIDGPSGTIGTQFPNAGNYEYGDDINVKATWWKKIATLIFAYDLGGVNIDADLTTNVNVVATSPHSDESNRYNFFGQNELGAFSIFGANGRIVSAHGRDYYFLFWTPLTIAELTDPDFNVSRFDEIDSRNLTCPFNSSNTDPNSQYPVIEFPIATCLKTETALFLYGTDITLRIHTNDDIWNNGKPTYTLEYESGHTYVQNVYSLLDNSDNNGIVVDATNFGYNFRCCPETNGNTGVTPEYIEPGYKFRGWYYGNLRWDRDTQLDTTITDSPNFWAYDENNPDFWSRWSPLWRPEIELTAIYTKVQGQTYTITYYSGLEEPQIS